MTQADSQQTDVRLDRVFEALERPLALIDNPERRADIQRFVEAARIHLERAIFDVLSDVVAAFNEAAGARARLEYQGGVLNLVVERAAEEAAEPEQAFSIEGDMEKVTIRIPADLKELIERAAGQRGVSINRWYVGELARTISKQVRDQMREDYREVRKDYREAHREERQERRHGGGGGGSLRGFVGDD